MPRKLPIRLDPFQKFISLLTSGGILLLLAAIAAFAWANSPWHGSYHSLWQRQLTIGFGPYRLSRPLHFWINDGLMAVFFLLVGLEIKRELLVGQLSNPRKAGLPIIAAAGGMLLPALIFIVLNPPGSDYFSGWGIPTVTDIAFAVGILAFLGDRVPLSLKVFLTALAIVDDLGAVLIIALFYSRSIAWAWLGAAAGVVVLLLVLNRLGVRSLLLYGLIGVVLWAFMLASGVHATIAGILLAITIPAWTKENETTAPLERLEENLSPWVNCGIMPLFALANAGVAIQWSGLGIQLMQPLTLGILLGLVLGKQLGITCFSWLGVRLGWAELPSGLDFRHVYGAAWLGGIGFTMALFIANLAFLEPSLADTAKTGIFCASLISGVTGAVILARLFSGSAVCKGQADPGGNPGG